MPKRLPLSLTVFLLASMGSSFAQNTHLDRMVAVVNQHVITESEWQAQESFLALEEGNVARPVALDNASLDRLMDRELILEQIDSVNFTRATPQEVADHVRELRQRSGATDDHAWAARLAQYGLDQDEFEKFAADQMDVVRFIENRFRQNARVTSEMVQAYYNHKFVPELIKVGTAQNAVPPLSQVQEKITQILVEQRVDEMLNAWLESLRNQAHMRRLTTESASDSTAEAGSSGDDSAR